MCFYADGEGVALRERVQIARKRHECVECYDGIALGEPYRLYVGIYEGDFFQVRWCARCDFVRHLIHYVEKEIEGCDEVESWPMMFGGLSEDWDNGQYAETLGLVSGDEDEPLPFAEIERW